MFACKYFKYCVSKLTSINQIKGKKSIEIEDGRWVKEKKTTRLKGRKVLREKKRAKQRNEKTKTKKEKVFPSQ